LLLLCDSRADFEAILADFTAWHDSHYLDLMRPKLGLTEGRADDAELMGEWLNHLQNNELDYTLSFRELATRIDATDSSRFGEFEQRWRQRVGDQATSSSEVATVMNSVNPLYIPRNHRVEQAISEAVAGDLSIFRDLNVVLARPFEKQPGFAQYAEAPAPDERVTETFCGT